MLTRINNLDKGLLVRQYLNELMDCLEREHNIVLDNSGTLDLSLIPACAVINVSHPTNAATINKIVLPNWVHELTIRPVPGTVVTWNDKVIGTTGANIRLNAPQKITDGSNAAYIKLQKRTIGVTTEMFETGFLDTYNQ